MAVHGNAASRCAKQGYGRVRRRQSWAKSGTAAAKQALLAWSGAAEAEQSTAKQGTAKQGAQRCLA